MENKVNTVICLWMGKTSKVKTPPGDFKVTTFENSLLSQQVVTSKGILVPYTNLQLNPSPIPNWTYSIVTIPPLQCTNPSTWLTNRCVDPSMQLNHQLKKVVCCKVLQFISLSIQWRSQISLVTKPNSVQTQQLLQEKDELGQILSPITLYMNKTLSHTCANFDSL